MKVIIKINNYYPDKNTLSCKICRLNSHIPIDDYPSKLFGCDDLNLQDTEVFIESLINKVSHRINEQDNKCIILPENQPEELEGELDIQSLVGKVYGGVINSRKYKLLKTRRVELWLDILKNARNLHCVQN